MLRASFHQQRGKQSAQHRGSPPAEAADMFFFFFFFFRTYWHLSKERVIAFHLWCPEQLGFFVVVVVGGLLDVSFLEVTGYRVLA
eukprot:EW710987.1.p2 GENE.EW710987.1~~EW710987.1.p2  ORF type:complete len:85 (-),score=16.76 EW710987.1:215-469(-)